MSWLDPKFRYHKAETHADSVAFRRRQIVRVRTAFVKQAEARAKVTTIKKRIAAK